MKLKIHHVRRGFLLLVSSGFAVTGLAVVRQENPVPTREAHGRARVGRIVSEEDVARNAIIPQEKISHRDDSPETAAGPWKKRSQADRGSIPPLARVEVVDTPPEPVVPMLPLVYRIDEFEFREKYPNVPLEVLDAIRANFEKAAGVRELSPTDPEYAERWKMAEATALDRMRTLFGWAAVAEYERRVAIEGKAAEPPQSR